MFTWLSRLFMGSESKKVPEPLPPRVKTDDTVTPPKIVDIYYVFRPLFDLLGKSEGTDKKRGYNETLSYGAFTGGDVNLVGMTLKEIDALQTKMLKHPKNTWNSSALGRYQIVRTTLRKLVKTMQLDTNLKFDAGMQDHLCLQLLEGRGLSKFLSGSLSADTFLNKLAMEWASIPTTKGTGHYSNQKKTPVTPDQVRAVLAEVKRRNKG